MKKNEMNPFFIYLFVGIAFIIMTALVIFLDGGISFAILFSEEILSKNRNWTNSVRKPSGGR